METNSASTYTLERPDGTTKTLEEITRDDWDGVDDPCPECAASEFNHYHTNGSHLGLQQDVVIRRSDFEAATVALATRCRACRTILHKHPLVDTLDQIPFADG